ncbi:MAG TPA: DUF5685 family protein [Blastocatellia bacterium]|nr:DUF5685 family protein [Blastocatellia bacterium]
MSTRNCGQTAEQKYRRRLHYCGTCKTLGRLYGQRSRLLLNHDAVFLGELLSLLAENGHEPEKWCSAYQSYNCLSLPPTADEMPLPLQFAAAANILLTEFKVADQIRDSKRRHWRLARRYFSDAFRRASRQLNEWKFPLDDLWPLQDWQDQREAELIEGTVQHPADEALLLLAGPTATATAMFFRHGVRLVNRATAQDAMARLGFEFGRLAYLLDAFEDYEKDAANGEFNALRSAYGWSGEKLTESQRRLATRLLLRVQDQIISAINCLPIPPQQAALFSDRLRINLSHKLRTPLPVLNAVGRACYHHRYPLSERWRGAINAGREMVSRECADCSPVARLKAPLIFALVLAVVFLFPGEAVSLRSWRDCLNLSFNLMFLSALPGAVLAATSSVLISTGAPHRKRRGHQSFCWDNCWCDCCSGCCEGCGEGCCECGCDSCCDGCHCH